MLCWEKGGRPLTAKTGVRGPVPISPAIASTLARASRRSAGRIKSTRKLGEPASLLGEAGNGIVPKFGVLFANLS